MAPATGREGLQHPFRMGFTVTFLTLHDGFVFRMAFCTAERCMFCITLRKHVVGVFMASSAGLWRNILGIYNLQGLMRWMAEHTVSLRHLRVVRLVTLQTLRNITMSGMMAGMAIELRMLGNICLHLLVHFRMTYVAAVFQGAPSRDIEWCVRLRVTGRTLG